MWSLVSEKEVSTTPHSSPLPELWLTLVGDKLSPSLRTGENVSSVKIISPIPNKAQTKISPPVCIVAEVKKRNSLKA